METADGQFTGIDGAIDTEEEQAAFESSLRRKLDIRHVLKECREIDEIDLELKAKLHGACELCSH